MTHDVTPPHYVRFARSLAFATALALPACGSSVEPTTASVVEPTETTATAVAAAPSHGAPPIDRVAETRGPSEADAAASDDAATEVASVDASAAPAPSEGSYSADAGDAAPYPFKSGPFPPPELPAGMA